LVSLRVLRLDPHAYENEDAGDAVGWVLVRCPYLDGLTELDLGGYKPGAAVRKELVARFGDALTGYGMRRQRAAPPGSRFSRTDARKRSPTRRQRRQSPP
jgi:hypothetical protein